MKNIYTIVAAIILAGLSSTASAQVQLYSSTPDFNGMGPTGTTMPLPWTYWYINGGSTDPGLPTSGDMATAVQGVSSLVLWNQTQPADVFLQQAGNEGATGSSTTRLLGTSPTEVRGDMLRLSLANNVGAPITYVSLSYDMFDMAPGTLKDGEDPLSTDESPGYTFYYSLDLGSTWTRVASLDRTSAGNASAVINLSTPVAPGGTLQFAWYDDNAAAFSPDHMYAIGNVTLQVPEPAAFSLFVLGALALIYRRRKA